MPKERFYKLNKEKQNKIIDSAYSEFLGYDYKKASVKRIAKTANISIGSFYDYFVDKDDLFLYLLQNILIKKQRLINNSGFKNSILMTKRILEDSDVLQEREKDLLQLLDGNNDEIARKVYFNYSVDHYMDSFISQLSTDLEKGTLNPHINIEMLSYLLTTIEYNILKYCEFKNISSFKDKMKIFNDFNTFILEGIFIDPTNK